MHQKFRRNDHRRKKTCRCIEQPKPCLLSDICDVTKIPGDEIIDLVKRGKRDVNSVGEILSMKYSARDITLGEDRDLFVDLELRQRF